MGDEHDQWTKGLGVQGFDKLATATNPFDTPEAQIAIEQCALPVIRDLAVQQAQNAARDFATALTKVKTAKKEQTDAEQAKKEMMWTIAITIALMPAGPVIEAAGAAIAGEALQSKMLTAIANNAGKLEAQFGAKGAQAANKAFDVVAGEAVTNMVKKFDKDKAKAALEAGIGALKDKTIKFAASSDRGQCVANYLDAMLKAANDSMHNLTNVIQTAKSYSAAIAFYNLFSKPLQGIYEAVLTQEADDMLSEIADALARLSKSGDPTAADGCIGKRDIVAKVEWKGRKLFAHAQRYDKPDSIDSSYDFVKWVTPDMEVMAASMAKMEVSVNEFENHVPDPEREPGERIVRVNDGSRDRLMLISIEDQGIFWKDYGVRTFKQWAETEEDEKAFRSRAQLQIGGLDKVDIKSIKAVPALPK